jgi:hypothetical protein
VAALTGILANPDCDSNRYTVARQALEMAKVMIEMKDLEYVKKD